MTAIAFITVPPSFLPFSLSGTLQLDALDAFFANSNAPAAVSALSIHHETPAPLFNPTLHFPLSLNTSFHSLIR
jgi:hypothetical protein